MTLLLVDDTVSYRARFASYLRTCLPLVQVIGETGSCEEALSLAQSAQPDVVTLDIQLDGGSGFRLLRELKTLPRPPIVIVLTHLVAQEYHATCLEAGADFFFDKAFGLEILETVLGDLRQFLVEDLSIER